MSPSSTPVTDLRALRGPVWRSLYLDVDGRRDDTTQVVWFQGPSLYVDLRRPAGADPPRPARSDLSRLTSPAGLATAPEPVLRWLGAHEGFAGTFRLTDDLAHWERLVDVQPPTGVPDEGRLFWDRATLVETGVHSGYLEHWHPEPGPPAEAAAVRLRENGTGRPGVLVRVGSRFGVARGRATALPPGPGLTARLLGAAPDDRAALLDCEVALGRVDADGRWVVEISTLPYREGDDLAPRQDGTGLTTRDVDADGPITRTWDVVHREGAAPLVPAEPEMATTAPEKARSAPEKAGDLDAAQ